MGDFPDRMFVDGNLFMPEPDAGSPAGGRVDYPGWLLRVFLWDGILPVCVLAIPQLALGFGAERSVTEVLSVLAPLLAFFARMYAGLRRVAGNRCGPILRFCQLVVFFHAAVLLVCIDTLMILSGEMNHGRWWANKADFVVWLMLFSIYWLAMLFALYPGRTAGHRRDQGYGP